MPTGIHRETKLTQEVSTAEVEGADGTDDSAAKHPSVTECEIASKPLCLTAAFHNRLSMVRYINYSMREMFVATRQATNKRPSSKLPVVAKKLSGGER